MTEQIIFALSNAVEAKDRYTNGHSQRVAIYAKEIVKRMGFPHSKQMQAYYSGLLHDIGKIRVKDSIINKKGSLTSLEYDEMKLHTMAGYYILKELSNNFEFAVAARWHHERYDGSGYPNGLSGENIPLIARVICVADAYDAMTSNRSYRSSLSQQRVIEELKNGMYKQFDPIVSQIMIDIIKEDKNFLLRQPTNINVKKILAIDDDNMVLRLLQFIFKDNPLYSLSVASSGIEAIKMLSSQNYDLVLLDVEMPLMSGFDVLKWIRKNIATLPVIFMTGDKDMEIIINAEALGINDYITKPLVNHILFESIQNVLATSKKIEYQSFTSLTKANDLRKEHSHE